MAKFPKQGQGHQNDISKPDCNAVMGLGRNKRTFSLTSKALLWNQTLGGRAWPATLHTVTWAYYPCTHGRNPDLRKLNQG